MADDETQESGFEYQGIFYPWNVTTRGHDLLLIDRISAMPPQQFFELIEDGYDLSRSSVTLSLIATSMRNRHPERSLERIVREVMALDIDEVEFMGVDEEVEDDPPASAGPRPASPPASSSAELNGSPASTSKTSSATSVSSGSPASATPSPA